MLSSNTDSYHFIYLPFWAKLIIIIISLTVFVAGIYIAVSYVGTPDKTDWIIVGISAAHVAATGLIITILVLFSESDTNISRLEQRSDIFLAKRIKQALNKITVSDTNAETLEV